jgi:hypothetical protein
MENKYIKNNKDTHKNTYKNTYISTEHIEFFTDLRYCTSKFRYFLYYDINIIKNLKFLNIFRLTADCYLDGIAEFFRFFKYTRNKPPEKLKNPEPLKPERIEYDLLISSYKLLREVNLVNYIVALYPSTQTFDYIIDNYEIDENTLMYYKLFNPEHDQTKIDKITNKIINSKL